jgi:anaphase-promoting complex subunit 8
MHIECHWSSYSPREAIECYKHALLYADPLESIIHLKIAEIYDHDKVKDMKQAAYYHQQVVEISREKGMLDFPRSGLNPLLNFGSGLTVLHYSRSAFYVGRYHVQGGGGDWGLAREYLSEVAQSNAEEVAAAQDVLKDLDRRMVEAMAQQRVVAGPPSMFGLRK